MARYMAERASNGPRPGNLMQDLLAAPSENDPATLTWIIGQSFPHPH
jgi:hypothetical protein